MVAVRGNNLDVEEVGNQSVGDLHGIDYDDVDDSDYCGQPKTSHEMRKDEGLVCFPHDDVEHLF